jgi:hypothetical protein
LYGFVYHGYHRELLGTPKYDGTGSCKRKGESQLKDWGETERLTGFVLCGEVESGQFIINGSLKFTFLPFLLEERSNPFNNGIWRRGEPFAFRMTQGVIYDEKKWVYVD